MRTFFEVDKKVPFKVATQMAEEAKDIGGYDYCDSINYYGDLINYCATGIDWQHPDRLKNNWVYVLSKKNKATGLVNENYPLFDCPHGLGKECMICPELEKALLNKFVKDNLSHETKINQR